MHGKLANLAIVMTMLLAFITCGCSSVQKSVLTPDELQDQIVTGRLVKPGDHVTVITSQGATYELEIARVTKKSIVGQENVAVNQQQIDENADISMQTVHENPIEIPVAEIRSIETREPTPVVKAAAATGAVVAVGGIMYVVYCLLPALFVSAIVGF